MKLTNLWGLILISFVGLNCTDWDLERAEFIQVVTVGISNLQTSSVTLVGEVENVREANIIEGGFVISKNNSEDSNLRFENENNQIVQSTANNILLAGGVFLVDVFDLDLSTTYYYRAYVKIEGEQKSVYGNIKSFTTLLLDVKIESVDRSSLDC